MLRNLPELAQLLFESNGSTQITKRHVVNHLLSHNWDIRPMHRSSVYATLSDLRSKIREHTAQEYTKFPQFLRRFIQLNPTATRRTMMGVSTVSLFRFLMVQRFLLSLVFLFTSSMVDFLNQTNMMVCTLCLWGEMVQERTYFWDSHQCLTRTAIICPGFC